MTGHYLLKIDEWRIIRNYISSNHNYIFVKKKLSKNNMTNIIKITGEPYDIEQELDEPELLKLRAETILYETTSRIKAYEKQIDHLVEYLKATQRLVNNLHESEDLIIEEKKAIAGLIKEKRDYLIECSEQRRQIKRVLKEIEKEG